MRLQDDTRATLGGLHMSAGEFELTFYTLDDGQVVNIKVQPETAAADFNSTTAAAATIGISANASGSMRRNGVNARRIYGQWATTAPDGYDPKGRITLPILEQVNWNTIKKGDALTYLGETFRVTGKRAENLV